MSGDNSNEKNQRTSYAPLCVQKKKEPFAEEREEEQRADVDALTAGHPFVDAAGPKGQAELGPAAAQMTDLGRPDIDWVSLALNQDDELAIFTDSAARCDTVLRLYSPDGATLLDEDDDSGRGYGSWIEFTAPSATPVDLLNERTRPLTATMNCDGPTAPIVSGGIAVPTSTPGRVVTP